MIRVKCHECRKNYNWEDDCFCPHCGAFNQAKFHGFDREVVDEAPPTYEFDESVPPRTSQDYLKDVEAFFKGIDFTNPTDIFTKIASNQMATSVILIIALLLLIAIIV